MEQTLTAVTGNGLGNRLRLLSSASVLADHYGFRLAATWPKGMGLEEDSWRHLFRSGEGIDFLEEIPTGARLLGADGGPDYSEARLFNEGGRAKFLDCYTNCDVHIEGAVDLRPFVGRGDIAIRSIYAVKPSDMSDEDFCRRRTAFYRENLHFSDDLKARVEEEEGSLRFPAGDMVGLHIRYTDNLRSRGKLKSGQATHVRQFEEYVRRALAADGGLRFLLCTDSRFVRTRMKAAFPENVILTRRGEEAGAIQAMAETVLLSRTREIVGTRPSTFCIEAAFMGDVPVTLFAASRGWVRYFPGEPGREEVVCPSEGPPIDPETMEVDFAPLAVPHRYRLHGREVRGMTGEKIVELSSEGARILARCDGLQTGWDIMEVMSHNLCTAKPELREGVRKSIRSVIRELAGMGFIETRAG